MAVFTKLVHTLYPKPGKRCICYINVFTTYIYQLIFNSNYLPTQFPQYCHTLANSGKYRYHRKCTFRVFKENYEK